MSMLNRNRRTVDTDGDGRPDTVDVRDSTRVDRDHDGVDDRAEGGAAGSSAVGAGFLDRDHDGVDDRDERGRTAVVDRDERRTAVVDRDHDGVDDRREGAVVAAPTVRPREVYARQRAEHGGVKLGAAFFGWLTALGTAVLLVGILSAVGAAVNLSSVNQLADSTNTTTQTLTIAGAVVVGVMVFLAYFAGGYVAGRMARFSGLSQGFVVWVIALVAVVVVAILTATLGTKYDLFANVGAFPSLNLGTDATTAGVTAAAIAVFVSLGGALLGGAAGMRYHRRVDRTPLVDETVVA